MDIFRQPQRQAQTILKHTHRLITRRARSPPAIPALLTPDPSCTNYFNEEIIAG
jgi:hypothetical protein